MAPLAFDELSPKAYSEAISLRLSSGSGTSSLWSKQPFEHFGVANKFSYLEAHIVGDRSAQMENKVLQSLKDCILKLLKLEGYEWLFRSNDGVDAELIDRVAMRERLFFKAELCHYKQTPHFGESRAIINGNDTATNMASSLS